MISNDFKSFLGIRSTKSKNGTLIGSLRLGYLPIKNGLDKSFGNGVDL